MDEGLKACPFCGSPARWAWTTESNDGWEPQCSNTNCPVCIICGAATEEEATAIWNTRPEPSTEAMRKALEAAWHALKSYEYGNASPDLAREVGLVIYTALAARAAAQGTEGQ